MCEADVHLRAGIDANDGAGPCPFAAQRAGEHRLVEDSEGCRRLDGDAERVGRAGLLWNRRIGLEAVVLVAYRIEPDLDGVPVDAD